MTMCEPLLQSDCDRTELEELILLAVASLVRMCPAPGSKPDSSAPMVRSLEAACGGKCFASLSMSEQGGYWQRMYGTYSVLPMFEDEREEPSDIYLETWPRMGIMLHGFAMALPTLGRRTKGTECLSWPTPRANKVGGEASAGFSPTLEQVVKGWPTPRANDAEKRGNIANDIRNGLPSAVKFATPLARDYRTGQQSRYGNTDRSRNLNDQIGGQLNADWVECLMNFPIGWTDVDCDNPAPWPGPPALLGIGQNWATPNCMDMLPQRSPEALKRQFETTRKGRTNPANLREQIHPENFPNGITQSGQYSYEPPRVITGQKNRAKRLKCLGNAVYPEQVYPILAAIREIEAGA